MTNHRHRRDDRIREERTADPADLVTRAVVDLAGDYSPAAVRAKRRAADAFIAGEQARQAAAAEAAAQQQRAAAFWQARGRIRSVLSRATSYTGKPGAS